ncbi:uncharacterized protein [Macrobrachium rosenbergii]|uniref:uncharacterized protein n=1 Tax=Macrobrachium rosenbergii TaxID=79674 RepID=UPI0034D74AB4
MRSAVALVAVLILGVAAAERVRRGGASVGGFGGGYGYGGGNSYGGYGGGSGGVHVLLAGNGGAGYGSAGAPAQVLNAGGGLGFYPSTYGAQQEWYYNAAIHAGDPYAAKTIGAGNYAIQSADAAAADAAHGVIAQANDPNIANAVSYLTHHADAAAIGAAAHGGAAYIVTHADPVPSYH